MKEIFTALITPFDKQGNVDFLALRHLVDLQLEQKVDGLIICGTTAETPALDLLEQEKIIASVLDQCKGRCKVFAGAGTNCTATTIARICRFERYDLDGYLIVTPYYNRPNEEGLYLHFQAVCAMTKKPIMLYHVPSRCSVGISLSLLERLLTNCENIYALKYASEDYETILKIKERYPSFLLYSGDDKSCFGAMKAGMDGVISVMSHLQLIAMREAINNEDLKLIDALKQFATYCFIDSSPAPIKYMLSKKGLCENVLRLPLCPVSLEIQHLLDKCAMPLNDKIRAQFGIS